MQLMEEKAVRGKELQKRLAEMDRANEDDRLEYWLVQYQKLLDSKPQQLVDRVRFEFLGTDWGGECRGFC